MPIARWELAGMLSNRTRCVEPTFGLAAPTPSPTPLVLALLDVARTGNTSNRQVSTRDEWMRGDRICAEVICDVFRRPRSKRMDADHIAVLLQDSKVGAGAALISTQS